MAPWADFPPANPDTILQVRVTGTPKTQGSMRAYAIEGKVDATGNVSRPRAVVVPDNKVDLKEWRAAVKAAASLARSDARIAPPVWGCAVFIHLEIILPRLASHPKTPRGKEPDPPTGRGDLDKHQRAIGDALVDAGILRDDGPVVAWFPRKRFAKLGEKPGAEIAIMPYYKLGNYLVNLLQREMEGKLIDG